MNLADPHRDRYGTGSRRGTEENGGGGKNETLSKSRREGTGTPMRAFSIHDPFAPLLQQARIGREQGEINSPVLILTDSTAK